MYLKALELGDKYSYYNLGVLNELRFDIEKAKSAGMDQKSIAILEDIKTWTDNIVLTTPAWFGNPEHDPLGNPYEHHLSFWTVDDFKDWEIVLKDPIVVRWKRS